MNGQPWITTHLHKAPYKQLTRKQETDLFVRIRAGDEAARARIVAANLKFVAQVANNYRDRGLPLEDVIAEGCLGLSRAVDRFDHLSGFKFITYAVWWIRQGILAALAAGGRVVNLPPSRVGAFHRAQKVREVLTKELQRDPSPEEVAEASGLPLLDVVESIVLCEGEMSLDWEDEEGKTRPVPSAGPLPDHSQKEAQARNGLMQLLSDLHPDDQEIILRFHGMRTGTPETLEEIGDAFGLTRERIRQRRNKAMDHVRRKVRFLDAQAGAEEETRARMARIRHTTSIGESSR